MAPLLAKSECPPAVPRRDEAERIRVGALDPRPLHMRIEVVGVDETGAVAVSRSGERPDEGFLAGLGADDEHLTGLHVRGEGDREVG